MFGLYLFWVFPEPALICSVDFISGRSFKIIKSYCSLVFHDNKSARVTSETAVEMPEAAWHPFSSPALPLQPWLDLTGVQVCSGLVHTAKDQPTFTPVRVSKVAVTLEENHQQFQGSCHVPGLQYAFLCYNHRTIAAPKRLWQF